MPIPANLKRSEKSKVSFQSTDNRQDPRPQLRLIHDLCQHSTGLSFEELFLSKGGLLCHSSPPAISSMNMNTAEIIPLDFALQAGNLSINQRMTLSLSVASSVMQLNSTPWLDLPLNINMVFLVSNGSMTPAMPLQPLIKHNFIFATMQKPHCSVRRTMLELGILLLELWNQQTFASFIADAKISASHTVGCRYDAACQWADESIDHIMPFHHKVIKRCVECNFATNPGGPVEIDWNDTTFRKSVCEHVLQPLWEECRFI
jgi:hypothetical protein